MVGVGSSRWSAGNLRLFEQYTVHTHVCFLGPELNSELLTCVDNSQWIDQDYCNTVCNGNECGENLNNRRGSTADEFVGCLQNGILVSCAVDSKYCKLQYAQRIAY